jgi:dUTP pyrophosphatase
MEVKIINKSKHPLPYYSTPNSAGMDLYANLENSVILAPSERVLIGTGLYIELPEGFEAQIRPRSGLAIRSGITVLNSPGTIDADYRGEIGIILINLSNKDYIINDGDRLCQMIVAKHEKIEWIESGELKTTNRGEGGFGHTGVQKKIKNIK